LQDSERQEESTLNGTKIHSKEVGTKRAGFASDSCKYCFTKHVYENGEKCRMFYLIGPSIPNSYLASNIPSTNAVIMGVGAIQRILLGVDGPFKALNLGIFAPKN